MHTMIMSFCCILLGFYMMAALKEEDAFDTGAKGSREALLPQVSQQSA